jgi:hypothetical protein
MQVAAENRKMLQRLNNRKSTVSSSEYYSRRVDDSNAVASRGHHRKHMAAAAKTMTEIMERHKQLRSNEGGSTSQSEVYYGSLATSEIDYAERVRAVLCVVLPGALIYAAN